MIATIQPVIGIVDGENKTFQSPSPYELGSLRVWQNGRLLQGELDNGFVEETPPTFRMKIAPRFGSTLKCFYREG